MTTFDPRRGKPLVEGQGFRVYETRNQIWLVAEDPLGNEQIHPIAGWIERMPKPLRKEWLGEQYDWLQVLPLGDIRVASAGGRLWIGCPRQWDSQSNVDVLALDADLNWVCIRS